MQAQVHAGVYVGTQLCREPPSGKCEVFFANSPIEICPHMLPWQLFSKNALVRPEAVPTDMLVVYVFSAAGHAFSNW